jgi:hypothetical protein
MTKTTRMIAVTIQRETKKGALVTDGVDTAWVIKSKIREGFVSERVWNSAIENARGRAEVEQKARDWRNSNHPIRIDVETEKAIGTKITFWSGDGEQAVERTLWFPKSMMTEAGVPGWMIEKKIEEVKSGFSSNACAFLDPADRARLLS